ncbi:homoserine dehydrogenase [Acidihalobacter yilgarnensis]|uniref:Homoserine dehydrogenase n=1 Tax=Acidihalobacter yilgarnensis TaxID=2819280 RepID=A0A1D8IT08_9GAMM|nr:homoserine dehydrogenase [Acidihalobacter yilgarnensis]AOU99660.1 homoserine dehydrogenase [Acidihalobacter yilgarnensis]
MEAVKVGLLGLGTVGCGVVRVLARNDEEIARRAGRAIRIVRAASRDLSVSRDCDLSGIALTNRAQDVVDDPEIDIVVELIGGTTIAYEMVMRAIDQGKHVVTANKALIALYGNEIFARASEQGVTVAFEAAVGGGIPIIKAIREALAGNTIEWLAGIINGTGNFILSEMRDKGRDFEDVLSEAQSLGYAEADPTFDVEGIDAAHKLTILASIAFGIPLQYERVYTEGITRITREDVTYAAELGYRIKHLGIARRRDSGIELRVHPTLIPHRRLIANVDGVMNAVLVRADAVGSTLYYGPGAGAEPTASAVVADLVDVTRALTVDPNNRVPHLAFHPDSLIDLQVLPIGEAVTAYYLRLRAQDRPGVLADITRILGDLSISIEAVLQRQPAEEATDASIVIITAAVREANMDEAIRRIEALETTADHVTRIRLENLS